MRTYFNTLLGSSQQQKQLPFIIPLLISLCAGAIFSLALAPYYYWWLAILSPALLYASLKNRTAKQAFGIGWAYGFGLWFVGAFWLYTSIHVYGDTNAVLSVLMIGFMALVMGLFSAVQTWLYRRLFPETPLTFAPLWIFFEWAKTWVFTGFPWLFAGYAFTERFLDGYAPLFGIFGVSFAVIILACALVEILQRRIFWVIPSALLLLGAWGASKIEFVQPKNSKPLSVSLIQGNIPQDLKWLTEYQVKTLMIYANLTRTEWGRDLIVWPESSIPMFQTDIEPFLDAMQQQAKKTGSAWVTGIPYWDMDASQQVGTPQYYNSIMASGSDSSGLYKKQRLVPFGEYIPLSGLLSWVLPALQNDPSMSGFSQGASDQKPLMIKGHPLAAAICYEIAYPNLTRRNAENSDFLVTVSNDAWFTGTAGPMQHLQMVQMRAKENGRWFIRATNTGVTAFIDQNGHIVKQAPIDKEAVLRGELPAMQGETLYTRLSDWPILGFSLLLLIMGWFYRPKQVDVSFKSRR
ncbi:apolipoprotein N-acyltransferase [Acinetobacter ursingii]|uniref:apolipoprotein N-acyltransferase n=1 Tax=Acinetobacter ursingii TaxID=108980 RepID=UPI0024491FD2|nr:apolipoprotein N-acyltransferase [Acinetobacter ursingii]MDH0806426.1 apolipoprotein N-acyltransferase [Acinetobacter ursingii]MDH2073656.1 apolipoprotein N-acyltransferase [Acinetobacter ursingii]